MAKYDRFIEKIAAKLQQVTEKEMRDASPKCPFVYYQPERPRFMESKENNKD